MTLEEAVGKKEKERKGVTGFAMKEDGIGGKKWE